MMDNRPAKTVYVVTEVEDQQGVRRTYWTTIGTAHVNKDGTISVRLDGLPLSGVLQIRDEQDTRRNNGQRALMLHDLEAAVVDAAMTWHVADRDRPWSLDPVDSEHNRARAALHIACGAINKRRGVGIEARLTRVEAATIGTQQPPPPPRTDVDAEELRLLRLVADEAGNWVDNGEHYSVAVGKAVEALRIYRANKGGA